MKKLFLLLALVGTIFSACEGDSPDDEANGNLTEQPGVNDEPLVMPTPATNEVYYITTDEKIVIPDEYADFGASIISNTYENRLGLIIFDRPVTSIGKGAFSNCYHLTSIAIPDSVTSIEAGAFYDCSNLTSVTIPNSVVWIEARAFLGCSNLTSVTIPDSVTSIGDSAFGTCQRLTSVTIGNNVTSIGRGAFYGCSSLREFKGKFAADNGRCLINDNTIIAYAEASGTTYTIPYGVTSIGYGTFSYCSSLTSVTIPDSVTSIGEFAFMDCSSLTSITISDSVITMEEKIPGKIFGGCNALVNINVLISDLATYCKSNVMSNIPGSKRLFLEEVEIIELVIPNSVTSIGSYAFEDCSRLTSVTIPDSVTSIGGRAFSDCSSLTSVTIGNSVTSIWKEAFRDCSSLTSVYCKATTPPTGSSYMFYKNIYGRKIYVPTASVEAYKSAQYWSDYAADIVGYDF